MTSVRVPVATEPEPGRDAQGLTVGEVAAESGVAASAVRFYERHGLIRATRTRGNQRRFGEDAPCRVKVARVAQGIGLSVREIAALLDGLPPDAGPADWGRLHRGLVEEAERRIARLRTQLDAVTSGRKLCELDGPGGPGGA
jgi:MerR family transcriptional regulator, redox-sensitive transcriptional activator SoxR